MALPWLILSYASVPTRLILDTFGQERLVRVFNVAHSAMLGSLLFVRGSCGAHAWLNRSSCAARDQHTARDATSMGAVCPVGHISFKLRQATIYSTRHTLAKLILKWMKLTEMFLCSFE